MTNLAHWCTRWRLAVAGGWLVALVALAALALGGGTAFTDTTNLPESESATAYALLAQSGGQGSAKTGNGTVVWHTEDADLVLMDIRMPGMDGIEASHRITGDDDLAGIRVLILTTFETDEFVVAALRAGASGFLGKGVDPDDLLQAVRTVAAGESLLSPSATTALIGRFLAQPDPAAVAGTAALGELTVREREIAALVGLGLSNNEIADRLTISPATAKTHVNRAMMKTGARDRAQLVIFAYENGLVRAGRP